MRNAGESVGAFRMPHPTEFAALLREDVEAALTVWLREEGRDVDELARRDASDFLKPVNQDGEVLDFRSLRYTGGAWLALDGARPNEGKSVMRHSTTTLTMHTDGHLFHSQEADTIARFPAMLGGSPEASKLRTTGTDDLSSLQSAHHATPTIALDRTPSHRAKSREKIAALPGANP